MLKTLLPLSAVFGVLGLAAQAADLPPKPAPVRRAIALPDSCNTPDAMAVLPDGTLILSVPNFTDPTSPGVLMQISPRDEVSLFCHLPLHPQTGRVFPMGVRQAPSGAPGCARVSDPAPPVSAGDLYVADCQFLDDIPDNSRLLCVRVSDGQPGPVEVVAEGLYLANGVAIRDGFVYVTDSATGKTADGAVASTVYRFRLDERGVKVTAGGDDPHRVATLKTVCRDIPVGADGIDFDDQGHLYVANCGDGVIEKLVLNEAGRVVRQDRLTAPGQLKSADGIFYDRTTQRIYVADILANALRAVTLDGRVETIAQDGDNDGSAGQLDGPSEAVVRGQELIAANFDRIFPGCVNTKSEKPYTLAVISLAGRPPAAAPAAAPAVAVAPGEGYRLVGTVQPRHAREIAASHWSVGAETMDRDFTVYAHWKDYLGPLGAKAARVQSGWAKTEKQPGKYDWAWLDAIIPDMVQQGVTPWVCLCYGNPVYEGGGGTGLGGGLPKSAAALAAWDKYVAAVVERYGQHVQQWEIWNEPAGPAQPYAELVIRTATVIRRVQPQAHIIAAAWGDVKAILEHLQQHDALGLVNEFTDHPYNYNPDKTYGRAAKHRELLAAYAGHLTLRQGENGAPSQPGSFGAIAKYDWTEEKQAKWALRRLLGDLGRDIPSSYFSICDMQYPDRRNYKGLLAINDDKTVHHAKHAYYAVQRVTAIFDNTVHRLPDFAGTIAGAAPESAFSLFGYRTDGGAKLVTLWRSSDNPGARPDVEHVTLTLPGLQLTDPVWVDLLSGQVYAIAASLRSPTGGGTTFRRVPVYDSVILIADRAAIPLRP